MRQTTQKILATGVLGMALWLAACSSGTGGSETPRDPNSDTPLATATFSKSYGGPLHDEAGVVLDTAEGGFMLLGTADGNSLTTSGRSPGGGDIWLQKLDASGNVEASRLFGTNPLPPDTDWRRARPLADGGVILTGAHVVTQSVSRPDGTSASVEVTRDVAVARLAPGGAVMWSVTFDSGAWLNYDYLPASGQLASARDTGLDVWPAPDGGFIVAGISIANLGDRLGIGFSCEDAEIDALAGQDQYCFDEPPEPGTFLHAFSVVVMRLNQDGTLRWTRRLTDNAFDSGNFDESGIGLSEPVTREPTAPELLVRATADGGVILARSIQGGSLVHRLGADGSPRWRAVLADLRAPAALVQTDDPVDGADADERDGAADDGFVVAGSDRIIKLDARGATEWDRDLVADPVVGQAHERVLLNDALQFCDAGSPITCFYIAVGRADAPVDGVSQHAIAYLLDDAGDVESMGQPTDGEGRQLLALTRVVHGTGSVFELAGVSRDNRLARLGMRLSFPLSLNTPAFADYRVTSQPGEDHARPGKPLPEFRPDGGALLLANSGAALGYLDARWELQSELALADSSGSGAEVLAAAVSIGAGRFVLVGTQHDASNAPHVIALRFDEADGGRIVWQRRFAPPAGTGGDILGTALAAAPSGEGVVVSVEASEGFNQSYGLLIKLDANGVPQWQVSLPAAAHELHAGVNGEVTALSFRDGTFVTRVSATGTVLWERRVSLPGDRPALTTMAPANDAGVILAGESGGVVAMAWLDSRGELVTGQKLDLHALSGKAQFDDLRIRQAADGSFILAMSESGLLSTVDAAGVHSYGEDNVFVLKVDTDFRPVWGRVYGARYAEGVRDLALRGDGTIVVAGFSDSLGDLRDAWLLKLSPDGLVSASGCQALLGTLPVQGLVTTATPNVTVESVTGATTSTDVAPFVDANLLVRQPQDFITARQCEGTADATDTTPGGEQHRLTLQLAGEGGVVNSTPAGISCGTGLDICTADFAGGSRVTLRADENRFVAWRSDCEEGTGGTQLTCVITMNADRNVQAEFRPAAPTGHFTLSFTIEGPGSAFAGDISCREDGQPANCSQEFTEGAHVGVRAFAELDWRGSGMDAHFIGWSGDEPCTLLGAEPTGFIDMDRDIHCVATFRAPNLHLLTITVTGAGTVSDDPPRSPSESVFYCREGGGGQCLARHAADTSVPLRATPDFGFRFVSWGGDCASFGAAPAIAVPVTDNTNCTATFEQATTPQLLTVLFNNGAPDRIIESMPAGIHCYDGAGADCTEAYLPGTEVYVYSDFPGMVWENCDAVTESPGGGRQYCLVRIDQVARAVIAVFPPR